MSFLKSLVETSMANALGWTLVHSLWQGAVIALLLMLVLASTKSPRVRYAAACIALLAVMIAFLVSLFVFMPQERVVKVISESTVTSPSINLGDRIPIWSETVVLSAVLPWLTPFWMAGVLLFQIRSIAGWFVTGRISRTGVSGVPDEWLRRLTVLKDRLQIGTPVQLFESCLTEVPVVIGYLRPVILVPAGLLSGMPAHQIEAILIHELAHIRRRDYLVNLIQTVVEGLLFYHPAVWWISRVIRNERENCCDDYAVQLSGNAHEYALALAALEETRWSNGASVAMAATGGTLMSRIRRLLSPSEPRFALLAPVVSACLLAITAALVVMPASPLKIVLQKKTSAQSPYQRWLNEDVVYIVTAQERETFGKLRSDEERQQFISQFWDRRNPTPGSSGNPFKEEHYRRIAYVNERYSALSVSGWQSDRGRVYILYGPPDEIEAHPTSQDGKPAFEQWRYHFIEGAGTNVIIEFVDVDGTGNYRMTTDPKNNPAQAGVIGGIIGGIVGGVPGGLRGGVPGSIVRPR